MTTTRLVSSAAVSSLQHAYFDSVILAVVGIQQGILQSHLPCGAVLASPWLTAFQCPELISIVTQLTEEADFIHEEALRQDVNFIMGAPPHDVRPVLPISRQHVPIEAAWWRCKFHCLALLRELALCCAYNPFHVL